MGKDDLIILNKEEMKISIIIPVYNAEQYIKKCLDSIVSQPFNCYEIILVNDGSTDGTGLICEDYARKYSQIRYIEKENGGVSSARNLGLSKAQGEYVLFVDADDYLVDDSLRIMDKMQLNEDVVFFQYKKSCGEKILNGENIEEFPPTTNQKEIHLYLSKNLHYDIMRTPWGKLIKRNIIGESRFPVGQTIGEDSVFMFSILAKAKSLRTVDYTVYVWCVPIKFSRKYQLPIDKSIEFLCNTLNAYREIGVSCSPLEERLYFVFYTLCKRTLGVLKWEWFTNPVVRDIWNTINCDSRQRHVKRHKRKFILYGKFMWVRKCGMSAVINSK